MTRSSRERAVRIYRERLEEPGESKRGARRHVGALLDVKLGNVAELGGSRNATGSSPAGARHPDLRDGMCAG